MHFLCDRHQSLSVPGGKRIQRAQQIRRIHCAKHFPHVRRRHRPRSVRNGLVEKRQPIAHAARGGPCQRRQGLPLERNFFGRKQAREVIGNRTLGHLFQVELQASTEHGDRDFLRIGRGQDKFEVLRRLLERLEHRVERRIRQHVDFVDDIDFEAPARRSILRGVEELAHLVHLGVGCRIHLEQVDEAAAVDFEAGAALSAGIGSNAGFAVQALGKDAGDRGLADAARAGEQVRVVQALFFQRVPKRLDHVLLAHQRGEIPWPVLARENEVTHVQILQRG